ncbi:hypothetical protein BDR22DRAFT_823102 [Usnea florida]
MKKVGLSYESDVQMLKEIFASTSEKIAVATVTDSFENLDDSDSLHPATTNSCLRLLSVAMTRGVTRLPNRLYVPTSIEEIYIGKAYPEILGKAAISSGQRYLVGGDVTAVVQEPTVMSITALLWKPDIEFIDPRLLIQPVQRETAEILLVKNLALLCMIEASDEFASAEVVPNHI